MIRRRDKESSRRSKPNKRKKIKLWLMHKENWKKKSK